MKYCRCLFKEKKSIKLAEIKAKVNEKLQKMKNIFALLANTIRAHYEERSNNMGPSKLIDSDKEGEE
jgi:hypothetical protein